VNVTACNKAHLQPTKMSEQGYVKRLTVSSRKLGIIIFGPSTHRSQGTTYEHEGGIVRHDA